MVCIDQNIAKARVYTKLASPTTSPPSLCLLNRIFQRNIRQKTHLVRTVRVVSELYRDIAIQERKQRRRIGGVLGPLDAERRAVRVKGVGEVYQGVEELAGTTIE